MSRRKFFLDSVLHFSSPYLIHRRSESLSPSRFLYFVYCFNQNRGLYLWVYELISCFCSFEDIHSGSWGYISLGPQVMRNGVFPAISVNQDDKVISFQPSRVLRKEECTPGLTAIRLEPLPKVSPRQLRKWKNARCKKMQGKMPQESWDSGKECFQWAQTLASSHTKEKC